MTPILFRSSVLSIQESKGQPRIWIEGKYLISPGFDKGTRIKIVYRNDMIIVTPNVAGTRIVSGKIRPIIDINNSKVEKIFGKNGKVNVIVNFGKILIRQTKIAIRKLTSIKNKTCASIFSGVGTIDIAARLNGYKSLWGIELEKSYADVWQDNFSGKMFNCSVEQVDFDLLDQVELLLAGIPCKPFSRARVNQSKDILHDTMDLSMFFLLVVERVNPRTIILEEVPGYLESEIGRCTISALKRLGYNVESKIMSGEDYNEYSIRKRLVVIASYDNIVFPTKEEHVVNVGDILDDSDTDCNWFDRKTKQWYFDALDNHDLKGNNFSKCRQIVTKDTDIVQTLPEKYLEYQVGSPIIKHPTEEKYRLFTPKELRMIAGIPGDFRLPSKSMTAKGLGQGVLVRLFTKIISGMC